MTREVLIPTGIKFDGKMTLAQIAELSAKHAEENPGESYVVDGDSRTICIRKLVEE